MVVDIWIACSSTVTDVTLGKSLWFSDQLWSKLKSILSLSKIFVLIGKSICIIQFLLMHCFLGEKFRKNTFIGTDVHKKQSHSPVECSIKWNFLQTVKVLSKTCSHYHSTVWFLYEFKNVEFSFKTIFIFSAVILENQCDRCYPEWIFV